MPLGLRSHRVSGSAAGAVLALAAGALLFTRFSLDDTLRRDESIYAYAGQQLLHGVPVYSSIFDPKPPLGGMIAGIGAALGGDQVHAMRLVFLAFSLLAVVGIYALGRTLWSSWIAALAAAVAFASFRGFALDAIGGPDAKTPGIAFGVVAMALLVRRRWFWGAFLGSLAFLVWQPLIVYVLVAGLGALLLPEEGERASSLRRVIAGAAIPVAAMAIYYAIDGALNRLVEAAVTFPLTGVARGHETFGQRLHAIWKVAHTGYGASRWVFWIGLLCAVAALVGRRRPGKDPYAVIVIASLVPLVAFSLTDFQGYADLFPILPYAAVGIGAAVAFGLDRLRGRALGAASAGVLAVTAVWFALSWSWFSVAEPRDTQLVAQRAAAAQLQRVVDPRETLYALGDPTALVLTGRRNPDRFIYLGSGVARWNIKHHPGGFTGWTRRIQASHPAAVVLGGWDGPLAVRMAHWLGSRRKARTVGPFLVFLEPAVLARAEHRGVPLGTPQRSDFPKPAA